MLEAFPAAWLAIAEARARLVAVGLAVGHEGEHTILDLRHAWPARLRRLIGCSLVDRTSSYAAVVVPGEEGRVLVVASVGGVAVSVGGTTGVRVCVGVWLGVGVDVAVGVGMESWRRTCVAT